MKKVLTAFLMASSLAMVTACADVPTDPEDRAEFETLNDPLEPMNRAVFGFNMRADKLVLKPIAEGYRTVTPETAQKGVHNVLNNLRSPMVFVNDVLQGEADRAAQTMVRFMINSTMGLGGLIDVVAYNGGPRFHEEDVGQTLAVWGISEGPYLMLPLFGPSNPRDAFGSVCEFVADPTDLVLANNDLEWVSWTRLGLETIDNRVQLLDPLDELERSSLDFYAAVRSVYRQRRANLITNHDVSLSDSFKGAK